MKELREILRELREDHDLKQETVASYLGSNSRATPTTRTATAAFPSGS